MKTCIAFLFFAIVASGQNMQPVLSGLPIIFGKTNIFNTSVYTMGVSSEKPSNQAIFSSYNNVTGLNDMYVAGSEAPLKSTVLLDNMYRGVKIDSFNPNGATNLEESLVSGALNLIFNGNRGRSAFIKL